MNQGKDAMEEEVDKCLLLQRASAGSGKTYALTGMYIQLLIGEKQESGKWRLRDKSELAESLRQILAVTFTLKATAEMKQRIVANLHNLAIYDGSSDKPDHLDDLCKVFGVKPELISRQCAHAISVLLHNYSGFNVSTIDSFFQSILRTFAFETNRHDSYKVELNAEMIRRIATENLLSGLKEYPYGKSLSPTTVQVGKWVTKIMEEAALKSDWNMFAPTSESNTKKFKSDTPKDNLKTALKMMDAEKYKMNRKAIKEYFRNHPDYYDTFCRLEENYKGIFVNLHKQLLAAIADCENTFKKYGYDLSTNADPKYQKFFDKLRGLDPLINIGLTNTDKKRLYSINFSAGSCIKKASKVPDSIQPSLVAAIEAVYDCLKQWAYGEELNVWSIYRKPLMYLGLMAAVEEASEQYLRENNTIELGETNSILMRIIGDSDTAFIFERIGTEINHYLIDEFQDTSQMQWNVLRPLLSESISSLQSNLIIGDAKQSIYRFRNAEPGLINRVVPSSFPEYVKTKGDKKEENTNRRSDRRIVEFNNSLFHALARKWDETLDVSKRETIHALSPIKSADVVEDLHELSQNSLQNIYSNVVQYPNNRDVKGYVEVNVVPAKLLAKVENSFQKFYHIMPRLVNSLRDEGFAYGHIAVLVRTNDQGSNVVGSFIDYNKNCSDDRRINFVSEEDLKVASSKAVAKTVAILGEISSMRGVNDNASDVTTVFRKRIEEMLAEMHAVTLPSLVEAIYAKFIPDDLKCSEGIYMAAFQDCVMDYCDNSTGDVASFLQWWEKKKSKITIIPPEKADAVQIMTYHKSKGLEFPVVIVIDEMNGKIKASESMWTETKLPCSDSTIELPPFVPLKVGDMATWEAHVAEYLQHEYDMKEDALNSLYVAFTRAQERLYVFTKEDAVFAGDVRELSGVIDKEAENVKDEERKDWMLPEGTVTFSEEGRTEVIEDAEYKMPTLVVGEKCGYHQKPKPEKKHRPIDPYNSTPMPANIKCKKESESGGKEGVENGPAKILHKVLAETRNAESLDLALMRVKVEGSLSDKDYDTLASTARSVVDGEDTKWLFSADSGRVLTSEQLLPKGNNQFVPDRIVIGKDKVSVIFFIVDDEKLDEEDFDKYMEYVKRKYPDAKPLLIKL